MILNIYIFKSIFTLTKSYFMLPQVVLYICSAVILLPQRPLFTTTTTTRTNNNNYNNNNNNNNNSHNHSLLFNILQLFNCINNKLLYLTLYFKSNKDHTRENYDVTYVT